MKDSGAVRVVAVELSLDDRIRVNGTILIAFDKNDPGVRTIVEEAIQSLGRVGSVAVDYPSDWGSTE